MIPRELLITEVFMKSIIQLIISLTILIGGSKIAIVKAHDTFRELAFSKIHKGLSPTSKLNNLLWNK